MTLQRHATGATLAVALATLTALPTACGSDGGGSDPDADAGRDLFAANLPGVGLPPALCKLQGPPKTTSGDVLVFADEFDGTSLDPRRWSLIGMADTRVSSLGTFSEENIEVENGSLFVTITKGAKAPPFRYTLGRIDTAHLFHRTYGRMDVRARFPIAPGVWYAIWSRPWENPFPEIDVEILAKTKPETYFVNHWASEPIEPADERRKAVKVMTVDPTVFHVYSVVWKKDILEFEIDGVKYMDSVRGVPKTPSSWTINAWVGGWAGSVTPQTPFPTSFEVDYFRVYRQGDLIAEPAIRMTDFTRRDGAPYNVPPYTLQTDALEVDAANFDEACFHVEMREGGTLLAELDKPPFRFPMNLVPKGPHTFTFTATDGVRSASVDATTIVH